jgi:uncharacterized protein (TIGR00725 family)
MKKIQIAIIWSAWQEEYPKDSIDFQKLYDMSYRVGFLLAENNCYVITGWKTGIMEAAAKWCRKAGWINIGFIKWDKREQSNSFVDIEIVTNMWDWGDAFLIPYSSDWAIIIWGWVGTLKEISWFYLQGKPCIALEKTWWWADKLQSKFLDERKKVRISSSSTPEEAVNNMIFLLTK